jgi:hypothetical protein
MAELLATHGLAILSKKGDLPPGVTRLQRGREAK